MSMAFITESSDRKTVVKQMKLALKKKNTANMYYCGGSLCIDISKGVVIVNLKEPKLTEEEKTLAALLYLEYKDQTSAFYELAKTIASSAA